MQIQVTEHARIRMQQRCISDEVLDLLLDYGKKTHDNRGGRIIHFDKGSRKRIQRDLGPDVSGRVGDKFNVYAVLGEDNDVVTVGHRFRRIKRS